VPTPAAPAAVVVLAAGEGTRMKSALPKTLHKIAGRSMLRHLIASCEASFDRIVVVLGPDMELVAREAAPHTCVIQHERLGTAPILLLDDPFAELDVRRSARILDLLGEHGMGQTLLTVPRETDIPPALTQLARWSIASGIVHEDGGVRAGAA